jgi:transcription elongation factor Elf1
MKLGINYLYEKTFSMLVRMRITGVRVIKRVLKLVFNCTSCQQENCIQKRAMLLLKKNNVMPTVQCCEIVSEKLTNVVI